MSTVVCLYGGRTCVCELSVKTRFSTWRKVFMTTTSAWIEESDVASEGGQEMNIDARVIIRISQHHTLPEGGGGAYVLGNQAHSDQADKSFPQEHRHPHPPHVQQHLPLLRSSTDPPKIRMWIQANACLNIQLTSACGYGKRSTRGKRDEGR